jgi:hypothetical protein
MRSTLAQLNFDVIRFVPHPVDIGESKVFLSKRLGTARSGRAPQPQDRNAYPIDRPAIAQRDDGV